MVGHEIDDETQARGIEGATQMPKAAFTADGRFDCVAIDGVVAMRRAGHGCAEWCKVQMAYAQLFEIGHKGGSAGKVLILAQLQPVGAYQRRHDDRGLSAAIAAAIC